MNNTDTPSTKGVRGVRDAILEDVETRITLGKAVPGFVIDSILRMHPSDIIRKFDGETALLREPMQDFDARPFNDAWDNLNYRTAPTIASYVKPLNLFHQTTLHPYLLEEMGMADSIFHLGAQRAGMKVGVVVTGLVLCEEFFNGCGAMVDVRGAVEGMLHYQDQLRPNLTIDELVLIDSTVDGVASLPETKKERAEPEIIICIPVASEEEHDTLPKTLEAIAKQTLDPRLFEVVLLHNTSMTEEEYEDIKLQDGPIFELAKRMEAEQLWTMKTYLDILEKYPNLQIRVKFAIHAPDTKIGYCRSKLGEDVASTYISRGSTNDPLLLNLDADVQKLNSDFLAELLRKSKDSNAAVIASRLKWAYQDGNIPTPTVKKLLKFDRFLQVIGSKLADALPYTDSGTAFRLRDYCLAGGHYWLDGFAESIHIVQLLEKTNTLNGIEDPTIVMCNEATFSSDARRQIDMMSRGYAPTKAWKEGITTFGDPDDPVRVQDLPAELAEENATREIQNVLAEMIKDILGRFSINEILSKEDVIRKGLRIIGLPDIDSVLDPVRLQLKRLLDMKPKL